MEERPSRDTFRQEYGGYFESVDETIVSPQTFALPLPREKQSFSRKNSPAMPLTSMRARAKDLNNHTVLA